MYGFCYNCFFLWLLLLLLLLLSFFYWVGQTFAHFFSFVQVFSLQNLTPIYTTFHVVAPVCVCSYFFRPLYVRLLLQDAQFSLPPHYVQRLNKLPKVYYVLLLFRYFIAFLCYCLHRLRQYYCHGRCCCFCGFFFRHRL